MAHTLTKTKKGFKFEYIAKGGDGQWHNISKGEVHGLDDLNFGTRQTVKGRDSRKNVSKLVKTAR